jgi:hypothetical protein
MKSILHVGGNLSDAVLANQSIHGSRQVFSPKCVGVEVLQRSMRLQPFSQLSVFSSISALLGNAGQANCTPPFCIPARRETERETLLVAQMLPQTHV